MATKRRISIGDPNTDTPFRLVLEKFLPYRLNMLANTVAEGFALSYAQHSREFGLDGPRWRVISFLGESVEPSGNERAMTARDVSSRTKMTKVTVSRAITDLEVAGLIRRETNESDRRESFLSLTAQGRKVYRTIVPVAWDFQEKLLEGFSDKERAELFSVITKIHSRATQLLEAL